MTALPATRLPRLLALIGYALGLLGILLSVGATIDARYAKAEDVQAIRQDLKCASRDIRLSNLRVQEAILRQEAAALETARRQRTLTGLELQRYNDVLNEYGQLQGRQKRLEELAGCP